MRGYDDDIAAAGDDLRDRIREDRAWDDSTTSEHDDHRQSCLTGCDWCDGRRQWAECRACGLSHVEFDDNDRCIACGEGALNLVDYDETFIHADPS